MTRRRRGEGARGSGRALSATGRRPLGRARLPPSRWGRRWRRGGEWARGRRRWCRCSSEARRGPLALSRSMCRLIEQTLHFPLLLLAQLDRRSAPPAVRHHQPDADRHRRPAVGTATQDRAAFQPDFTWLARPRRQAGGRPRRRRRVAVGRQWRCRARAIGQIRQRLVPFQVKGGNSGCRLRGQRGLLSTGGFQRQKIKAELAGGEAVGQFRILRSSCHGTRHAAGHEGDANRGRWRARRIRRGHARRSQARLHSLIDPRNQRHRRAAARTISRRAPPSQVASKPVPVTFQPLAAGNPAAGLVRASGPGDAEGRSDLQVRKRDHRGLTQPSGRTGGRRWRSVKIAVHRRPDVRVSSDIRANSASRRSFRSLALWVTAAHVLAWVSDGPV